MLGRYQVSHIYLTIYIEVVMFMNELNKIYTFDKIKISREIMVQNLNELNKMYTFNNGSELLKCYKVYILKIFL